MNCISLAYIIQAKTKLLLQYHKIAFNKDFRMRLNQYIAHHSTYSRREADALIESRRVRINNNIANPTSVLKDGDIVFVDGKRLKQAKGYTAIIYHKPKGEIVSKKDEFGRRSIYDSLDYKFKHFVYAGRLDYASEGLLILSDSKKVVSALMESSLPRTYNIKLDKGLNKEILDFIAKSMESGEWIEIAGKKGAHTKSTITKMFLAPFVDFVILKDSAKFPRIRVTLCEGKNRELRRFFAYFNYEVRDLKRVSYGFCSLNGLVAGKWRYFNRNEYNKLHHFMQADKQHT